MIRTRRLAALVLLAVLAGCGGDHDTKGAGTPAAGSGSDSTSPRPAASATATPSAPTSASTSTPTSTSASAEPSPVRQADAARALSEGLHSLLGGGQVDFRYGMNIGAILASETTGRAAIAGGWRSSTHFSEEMSDLVDEQGDGDDVRDLRMEVRAPGSDDVFMQMVGWPEPFAGCWLHMGRGEVPVGFLAMGPGLPAYVGVLGELKALGFDPEHEDSRIRATVSLRAALLLLTGRTVQALDVPPEAFKGVRLPADVFLEDGVVTDVAVNGDDIVDAVRAAGGEPTTDYATVVSSMSVHVRYTPAPAGADPVTPPEAALVMTAEDMDAERGC